MFGRPEKIRKAVLSGDSDYLSNAGKKGAETANENRRLEEERTQTIKEAEDLQRQIEDEERIREANEHIITGDGIDLDYNETNDSYQERER
jgi:hypothetical protein